MNILASTSKTKSPSILRLDSNEYDFQTMKDKYLNGEYTYVKGFYGFVK